MAKITNNALEVLKQRIFQKCETKFEDVAKRVSNFLANDDKENKEFYDLINDLDFLPNSPTLANAGTEINQLSACFVLPIEDSMEGIFETIKNTALIHKSGGGTGFNFSNIRGKNSPVNSTNGVASGPISFMNVFNEATNTIKQGGKRRGANMGVLNINHPDIYDFIVCKNENDKLTNFNISVGIDDDFMNKVINNQSINQKEKELFNKIAYQAWKNGEPGIIFLNALNRNNKGELIDATNPCGEIPLRGFEACNLGSINLVNMLTIVGNLKFVDFRKLEKTVRIAVHMLNRIIDKNEYPLKQIEEQVKKTRKIGLGIMGYADALIQMNIKYGSEDSYKFIRMLMGVIKREAEYVSKKFGYNNETLLCVAPTGTLSIIANVSSSIEPNFGYAYSKNIMDSSYFVVNAELERYKDEEWYNDALLDKISKQSTIQSINEIPNQIRELFLTTADISVKDHIKTQATFQAFIDNAVSKTINMSSDATIEDVKEAYIMAWKMGCKGITVYRDGSRSGQVLETVKKEYCEQCGSELIVKDKCKTCVQCNNSLCSL